MQMLFFAIILTPEILESRSRALKIRIIAYFPIKLWATKLDRKMMSSKNCRTYHNHDVINQIP